MAMDLSDIVHTDQAVQINQLRWFVCFINQWVLPFSELCTSLFTEEGS